MIICNGPPKTGTNLLQKACALLGKQDSGLFMVAMADRPLYVKRLFRERKQKEKIDDISYINDIDDGYFCHAHVSFPCDDVDHPMLLSIRNPRAAAVSFVRWASSTNRPLSKTDKEPLAGSKRGLIKLIERGVYGYTSWVELYASFLPWIHEDNVCCVWFDDLFQIKGIQKIANFIGEYEHFPGYVASYMYGNGNTLPDGSEARIAPSSWSGELSKWTEWWNKDVESAWKKTKGYELEQRLEKICDTSL